MIKKEVPMFFEEKLHLTFDDVCLITGLTTVESRSDVDLTSHLPKGYKLGLPIMTAAMDTITSKRMARAIVGEKGAIVHHRNQSLEERINLISDLRSHSNVQTKEALNGVAVGLSIDTEGVEALISAGANLICLEVAHAYMEGVAHAVNRIGPVCSKTGVLLMVGNFSSVESVQWLRRETDDLVDIVKVSQGGGSCCSTRLVTGMGKPTLQAVLDLAESGTSYHVVADGGIRNSGAIAKALGAGACAGMIGGMLSGTRETPGVTTTDKDGNLYKEFRGMASAEAKKANNSKNRNVEGITTQVPYRGSVREVFFQIRDGLSSSVASTGFTNLSDFQRNAQFIRVSNASQREAVPHARWIK